MSQIGTAVGSLERRPETYDHLRVLRRMTARQERAQESAHRQHANVTISSPRLVLEHKGADGLPSVTLVDPSEGESKIAHLDEAHSTENDSTSNMTPVNMKPLSVMKDLSTYEK